MEEKQTLFCVSGPLHGRKFAVDKEFFRIGASRQNDLVIADDDYVSGTHAYLRYDRGTLILADQHSKNGTFVNNHRLKDTPVVLDPGNRFRIGNSMFEVVRALRQPQNAPAQEDFKRWDNALTALEDLYRDVERRSLSLPGFSLWPIANVFWNSIKFEFCLLLDILLLPINATIFFRNLFPGKWRYRSFSGSYWRYIITWLWRGEAPVWPIGVIRPLVTFLVMGHIHNRIKSLKRYVFLDDNILEEDRLRLETKIAGMQERWKTPSAPQVVYNFVLPASGPLAAIYKFHFSDDSGLWITFLGFVLISYSLFFVVTGFMIKRALMLGASGRALYFPGAIAGTQCYGKEREIFNSLGIPKKEFPFDIAVNFVSILTGFLWGVKISPSEDQLMQSISGLVFGFLVNALALYRRNVTGRL
jgi:Inner membrane component of T3SS, cytoplasmic domain